MLVVADVPEAVTGTVKRWVDAPWPTVPTVPDMAVTVGAAGA